MDVHKNIRIDLSEEERETIAKVNAIITEFANKDLCDKMSCYSCPFAMFCQFTDSANDFETTLNDIANME